MRRIQGVSKGLLQDIWRIGQGVDVSALFRDVERLDLYESPTGLVYFYPMVAGDERFYETYYRRWAIHGGLTNFSESRLDYVRAASHVPKGAKVIDVGCGPGAFRQHVAHADYTGLDPYAAPNADAAILRDTLERHAASHMAAYDVATAFHVIEHVADPRRHVELMVKLLKPGGLLVLAAPLHPSPLTEIPNFPLNMPPHHVTWWNPKAFSALADELGLEVLEASALGPSLHQQMIVWLHQLLLWRTSGPPHERYFAHRWSWHASLALAYGLSQIVTRLRFLRPSNSRPLDAFLVARRQ